MAICGEANAQAGLDGREIKREAVSLQQAFLQFRKKKQVSESIGSVQAMIKDHKSFAGRASGETDHGAAGSKATQRHTPNAYSKKEVFRQSSGVHWCSICPEIPPPRVYVTVYLSQAWMKC